MKLKPTPVPRPAPAHRKTTSKAPTVNWQERCSQLEKECEQLRRRVDELRAQRAEYSQIICDQVYGKHGFQFGEDEALAELAKIKAGKKGPTLLDLIEELRSAEPKKRTTRRGKKT